MNAIPKTYLTSRYGNESVHLLRKWLSKSECDADVLESLLESYKKARPVDKRHIGYIISMVMDMKSRRQAATCIDCFGGKPLDAMSIGESILAEQTAKTQQINWRRVFSKRVKTYPALVNEFDFERFPLVFPEIGARILCLSKDKHVYAYRTSEGSLNLLIINTTNATALVDEESFSVGTRPEPPLYFTEYDHFTSPVFTLRCIQSLLTFVLEEIGYPSLEVGLNVFFCSPSAILINRDEYNPGGEKDSFWEGVNIYMRSDYPNDYVFSAANILPGEEEDSPENTVAMKLVEALAAVAILYSEIGNDDILSVIELQRLAAKTSIFAPRKSETFSF